MLGKAQFFSPLSSIANRHDITAGYWQGDWQQEPAEYAEGTLLLCHRQHEGLPVNKVILGIQTHVDWSS